jgi:serine/threonine-protein kinase
MALSIHLKEPRTRFIQEQQILASLNHHGIAQLYDAGVTESGNPYLIMEYVKGEDLISYSKKEQLILQQKLSLFLKLCESIEFAHQNLIVHRDLKPGNIFVTNDGSIKVLDFGISKLLSDYEEDDQQEEKAQQNLRLYTLNYAAPEQIKQERISTGTDVYTLGLLLFELLTEQKPFDLSGKSRKQSEEFLLNTNISKPSSIRKRNEGRFTTDLDFIIEKATRKKPQERYASVRELREDIERFLNKEPVVAKKGDLLYHSLKFMTRNRSKFIAGCAFMLIFITVSAFYITSINREKQLAQHEAERAATIQEYLIELFESADPTQNSGEDITVKEYVNKSIERLSELDEQPEIKADLVYTLARIAHNTNEINTAIELYEMSYQLEDSLHANETLRQANILLNLGKVHEGAGRYRDAIAYFKSRIDIQESLAGLSIEQKISPFLNLGQSYAHIGEIDSAEMYLNLAKSQWQNELTKNGKNDLNIALADIAREKKDYKKAVGLETKIVAFYESEQKKDTIELSHVYNNLAFSQSRIGAYSEAELNYKKALKLRDAYFDSFNAKTSTSLTNLARVLSEQNKDKEALAIREENLFLIQNEYGKMHWRTANALAGIAKMHRRSGKFNASLEASDQAVEIYEKVLGKDHLWTSRQKMRKAITLQFLNRSNEAKALFKERLEIIKSDSAEPMNYYEIDSFRKMKSELDTLKFIEIASFLEEYLNWYDNKFQD